MYIFNNELIYKVVGVCVLCGCVCVYVCVLNEIKLTTITTCPNQHKPIKIYCSSVCPSVLLLISFHNFHSLRFCGLHVLKKPNNELITHTYIYIYTNICIYIQYIMYIHAYIQFQFTTTKPLLYCYLLNRKYLCIYAIFVLRIQYKQTTAWVKIRKGGVTGVSAKLQRHKVETCEQKKTNIIAQFTKIIFKLKFKDY